MISDRIFRVTPFLSDTFMKWICVVSCILTTRTGKVRIHMSKKTHTNPFSQQEIEHLMKNPYVKKVTVNSIMFTEEFKRLVYEEKHDGKSISEIMRSCQIDPEILGESRISGFTYTLNKKAKTEDGFTDQRHSNYHRPAKDGKESVEQRIKQLENELAYTRQEVEFLKKLQTANMEAQRRWKSKHRQK